MVDNYAYDELGCSSSASEQLFLIDQRNRMIQHELRLQQRQIDSIKSNVDAQYALMHDLIQELKRRDLIKPIRFEKI